MDSNKLNKATDPTEATIRIDSPRKFIIDTTCSGFYGCFQKIRYSVKDSHNHVIGSGSFRVYETYDRWGFYWTIDEKNQDKTSIIDKIEVSSQHAGKAYVTIMTKLLK